MGLAEATGPVTILLSNPFTGTDVWVLCPKCPKHQTLSLSQPLREPELWQLVLEWPRKADDMMVYWL